MRGSVLVLMEDIYMKRKLMLLTGIAAMSISLAVPAMAEGIIIIGGDNQQNEDSGEKTPVGMYLGHKYIGEMTKSQVYGAIDELVDELKGKSITLTSDVGTTEISLGDMDITCTNRDAIAVSAVGEHGYGNLIQQYKQIKDTEENGLALTPEYSIDGSLLVEYLINEMPELESKPQNASLVRKDNGEFEIIPSKVGFTVDMDETYNCILTELKNYDGNSLGKVEIVGQETEAVYDDSVFEGFGSVLGSWTTKYLCVGGSNANRAENIRIAASRFNGMVLMPGEEFSFVNAVQPFTEEAGFKKAGTIIDGVTTDDLGGGVCQVSTTLYNACLYSELFVSYRKPHSKVSAYVDTGLDAMVYVRDGSDFRFVNSTEHAIYIEGYTTPNYQGDSKYEGVTFNIYGTEYRDPSRTIWYEGVTTKREWPESDVGAYEIHYDEKLDAAGNNYGGNKMMSISRYPHPFVTGKVIKHEYIDGVEVSAVVLDGSYVQYSNELGILNIHPDSKITSFVVDDDMNIKDIKIYPKNQEVETTKKPNKTTEAETDESTTEKPKETTTEEPTTVEPTTEEPTIPPTEPTEPPVEPTDPPEEVPETPATDPVPGEGEQVEY